MLIQCLVGVVCIGACLARSAFRQMAQDDSFDLERVDISLTDVDPRAYEEAQLAAAIAASLADVGVQPPSPRPAPPRSSKPVDAISISSSSGPSSPSSEDVRAQTPGPAYSLSAVNPTTDAMSSVFLIERAGLEQARLARQKRRREEMPEERLPQTPGAGPSNAPTDALGVLRATKRM